MILAKDKSPSASIKIVLFEQKIWLSGVSKKWINKSSDITAANETAISEKFREPVKLTQATILLNQLQQNPQQAEHFWILLIVYPINHALTLIFFEKLSKMHFHWNK